METSDNYVYRKKGGFMKMKIFLYQLLFFGIQAHAQTGGVKGVVTDSSTGEPIVGAVIQAMIGDSMGGGTLTDIDGRFYLAPLPKGMYKLCIKYIGYLTDSITGVLVDTNIVAGLTAKLVPAGPTSLRAIAIIHYKVPLVDYFSPGANSTYRAEQIRKLPTHSVQTVAGNFQIQGGRTDGNQIIVDGVQVNGSNYNVPASAIDQQEVMPSGLSAKYENPDGGFVVQGNTPAIEQNAKPQQYDPSIPEYRKIIENEFMNVNANPLSTMSVDVDRASYSNIRRFLDNGELPPPDAVRIEEMINYFDYDYTQPQGKDPVAINTELITCPWNTDNLLLRISIQAKKIDMGQLPPSNLVFLIDVSGSMESPERLPLLVAGMKLLVNNLRPIDRVSIVTYAGNAGLALPPTSGANKQKILDVLDQLEAGGSTAGGAGIKLAYKIATENFIKGGNNRVLLATDGDFNVGVSSDNELEDLITEKRKSGVFLTCLGFGDDNYKDAKMEMMADKGNGNYDYIDNLQEAQKTLVSEFGGTLFTVAKDVKAQIEFNPAKVQGYRLIGYEDRLLNEEDFKDDIKDAGDMGSGHVVTILYELIPAGIKSNQMRNVNELKYQSRNNEAFGSELATVKFRYKKPDGDTSTEITHTIANDVVSTNSISENTRFASAVAMFGMLLRDSKFKGSANYNTVLSIADAGKSFDKEGYRGEFIRLVKIAKQLDRRTASK